MSAACRAFEQRLFEALDLSPEGAAGRAARALATHDAHTAACPACALLASLVAGHADVEDARFERTGMIRLHDNGAAIVFQIVGHFVDGRHE